MIQDIQQELGELDTSAPALQRFGLLMGAVFALLAGILFWRGSISWAVFAVLSPIFMFTGLVVPQALRQPYRYWMLTAFMLGWTMTRILLTLAYWVVMAPMGLFLRLSGRDVLDARIDKTAASYWKKHEPVVDRGQYNKQF